MKFYDIALFLFIINVFGMIFVNLAPLMGYSEYFILHKSTQSDLEDMESKVQTGISTEEITGDDPVTYALGIMYAVIKKALLAVFNPLKDYVLWFPYLLMTFGVPAEFSYGIGVVYYLVMIVGLAQVVTGRYFRSAE